MSNRPSAGIRLNRQENCLETTAPLVIPHEVVFRYFDSIPQSEYSSAFERALVLGCYALHLDSIAEMLDQTARELDGRLVQLKVLLQLRGIRERSPAKGEFAEVDLVDVAAGSL